MTFSFSKRTYLQQNANPRLGVLTTPHGTIETPAFIFCATKGVIKGLSMEDMLAEETQIILANTFHLMLSPGAETVEKLGGLAEMSSWNKPTLTDSGGYQIFSMGFGSVAEEIKGNRKFKEAKVRVKITEEGAEFKSYLDGKKEFLTPERSIEIQGKIGADLIVAFDECTPFHVAREYTAMSMERSHRWEKRSLLRFSELEEEKENSKKLRQALYGIVQGGVYEELRKESCDFVNQNNFFGQAIGGSLGASKEQMRHIIEINMKHLRDDRPTHLLGIGKVEDIFHGVSLGIDTFDCVHPTRIARHGCALVRPKEMMKLGKAEKEHINLKNNAFIGDKSPIEEDCTCNTCRKYSRGYINHLLKNNEIIGCYLIVRHNVHFMNLLMSEIRKGIKDMNLSAVKKEWLI